MSQGVSVFVEACEMHFSSECRWEVVLTGPSFLLSSVLSAPWWLWAPGQSPANKRLCGSFVSHVALATALSQRRDPGMSVPCCHLASSLDFSLFERLFFGVSQRHLDELTSDLVMQEVESRNSIIALRRASCYSVLSEFQPSNSPLLLSRFDLLHIYQCK